MRKIIFVFLFCVTLLFIPSVQSQDYPGFRIIGRYLYDKCGEQVLLRGVANPNIWFEKNGIPRYAEIEKTGANVVRIVWETSGTADFLNQAIGMQPLANYLSTGIKLFQNTPNPFTGSTQITYVLNTMTHVKLAVYSCLGEEIQVLVNTVQAGGEYTVNFNLSGIAEGIYFCSLTTLEERELRKMLRVK